MYDVNPLGPLMHLKELERQVAPKLRPVRRARKHSFRLAVPGAMVIALLRRLHAAGIPRRAATRASAFDGNAFPQMDSIAAGAARSGSKSIWPDSAAAYHGAREFVASVICPVICP
jgi:hypothetical protein